jgi:asparagine synthase (glutamine-hydrolysing)
MDFIFGCWSDRRSSVDCRGVTERMTAFFERQGVPYEVFPFDPHFAGGAASFITEKSKLRRCVLEEPELIAVGDVTLYDPPEPSVDGPVPSPLAGVAKAHGDENRLARLNGDFAAAVYDRKSGAMTLIRDHCGIVPLHYSQAGDACAFASLVRPLLLTPWATDELDEIALATYLVLMAPGRERTYFTSAKSVLPASRVVVDSSRPAVSRKYWLPRPAPGLKVRRAEEAYEAVREQLVRAVVSRAKDVDNVGIKLSGGLDSSAIAGILCAKFPERTFQAVSGALPLGSTNPKGDERAYIEETKKRYPNLRVTYETAEGVSVLAGAEHWWTWLASPVTNEYWYLESSILRRAKDAGVRYLFSGFGGDQCVSTKGHAFLAECIFGFRPLLFLREFRRIAEKEKLSAIKVVRYKIAPVVLPAAIRRPLSGWRHGPWHKIYALAPPAYQASSLKAHLRACGFFADLARSFHRSEEGGVEQFDIVAPAIEKGTSAPLGIRTRFPLIDARLLEAVMAIPWEFKVSEKLDRMLIRGAAQPFLPRIIAERPDKGYVSPDFEDRMRAAEPELRRTLDTASRGAQLRPVDVEKVAEAVNLLKTPDPQKRDLRLIRQVALPCRLAEFVTTAERRDGAPARAPAPVAAGGAPQVSACARRGESGTGTSRESGRSGIII